MNAILKVGTIICLLGLLQVNPAECRKGFGPGDQEWGFVDVRKGAHMFYWLYFVQDPIVTSYYDAPLVIWLQGGPGGSSTGFGNFEEIGPLYVNLTERSLSWAKYVNLLLIDNPVGTGFSYVDDYNLLTTTNEQIGKDMVKLLMAFYKRFPKFEKTPVYIFCESYGGKMAVEIAKQMQEAIDEQKLSATFKGVALGDSWISPEDSVNTWAPFLYYTGMIDKKSLECLSKLAKNVQKAINEERFLDATRLWSNLEGSVISETYNVDFYNILYKVGIYNKKKEMSGYVENRVFDEEELEKLMNGPVKKALDLPDDVIHAKQSSAVFKYLSEDFMKPVVHVVEELLNNTNLDVVVFTGNLDLIVDTPGTLAWISKLHWKGAEKWKTAPRKPIILNKYIEGYVKNVDRLYLYWVTRSGHMVPTDNPEVALEILRRTTKYDQRRRVAKFFN